MTHEHMLRTVGRVKGFVFLATASVQLVLSAFAFALTGTAASTLAAVLSINDAESAIPDRCHARLLLRLTLDVPNPRDPSFLSALTANPLYEIVWVDGNDTTATVDLMGPATDYHCEDEIKRMRRDAHIMDLKVLQPDSENDGPTSP
jgi:hypothetical protein